MSLFGRGQKRKALVSFDSAVRAISKANDLASLGDYGAALSHYNEAIEALRSDTCQQLVASRFITASIWSDQICAAIFGKARAVAALERRGSVVEQVEKIFSEALGIRPDWPEAHEFIAELALSHGRTQNARRHIDLLAKINPHHERARFLLAVLDFDNHQYDEALNKLAALKESADSLCYMARCDLRKGRFDEAIETLERAKLRFGERYDCYYYLGCALGHAGRFEDAKRVLGQLCRWTPRRAEPMIQLGNLYLLSGLCEDAERFFNDAFRIGADHPLPAYYGLAMAASDDSDEFNARLGDIRRIDPNSDLLHCALGDRYERAGQLEEAAREYSLVSPHGVMAGVAHSRLGFMHFRQGNFSGAVEELSEALRLRPSDRRLHEMLGASAALVGDYKLAADVWSKLPTRRRTDDKISRALGAARLAIIVELIDQHRIEQAIEQLEQYNKGKEDALLQRTLADLRFNISIEALGLSPPDLIRAREHLSHGKRLTAHPRFEYCLAIADLIEGDDESAASRLRVVLAHNAKNPGASYHLGLALLRSGDVKGAENALRHGIAVSFNQPSKLGRLKWALAAVLVRDERWSDAVLALRGFVPSEEADARPTLMEVLELKARSLAMDGKWEAAERLTHGRTLSNKTALADTIAARRSNEIRPAQVEIPIILPPTPPKAADLVERPHFDANDWDASPYPDPLAVFDS